MAFHMLSMALRTLYLCADGGLRQVLAAVGEDVETENSAIRTAWFDAPRGQMLNVVELVRDVARDKV